MQLINMAFNLDNFVPFQLSSVANQVSRALGAKYEKQYGISRTQWRIMAVLAQNSQTGKSIARKTVMDKSVISRAVKDLIAKKYVRRIASQSDGRETLLSLTPNGKRIAGEISTIVMQAERDILSKIAPEERDALMKILIRLSAAQE